jgi:Ca2+-binding EF-hand superfamily protein
MELEELFEKEFRRIDKNDDKFITIDELRSYYLPLKQIFGTPRSLAEQEIQSLLKRIDTDGDGKISLEGRKEIFFAYFLSTIYSLSSRIQNIYD